MERIGLVAQAHKDEKLAHLCSREASLRQTILFSESGVRNGLLAAHLEFLREIQYGELAVRQLWNAFCQSREVLEKEWAIGMEMILDVASSCRRCFIEFLGQRTAMLDSAMKTLGDIVEEERDARHRIQDEMTEESHCIDERTRLFLWQRSGLEKMELSVRQSIVEEMKSWLQQLHVECSRARWEVEEAIQRLKEERERALQNALEALNAIAQEESDAFANLLERKTREHEKLLLWLEEKERSQANLAQRFLAGREYILNEETRARQDLMRDLEKGEMNILEWVALQQRRQQELWAEAEGEKVELSKREHERRLHLMFRMAGEEESIHRLLRFQHLVLQKQLHEEATERRLLVQQESVDFDLLAWLFATEREAHTARGQAQLAQRAALEEGCQSSKARIAEAEAEERRRLWEAAGSAALRHVESEAREGLARQEGEGREALTAHIVHTRKQHNREVGPSLAAQRAALETTEREARLGVRQEAEKGYEAMYRSERQAQLELVLEAERQVHERLYAFQACQCEDARSYDEQELLPELVADESANLTPVVFNTDTGYACDMKLAFMLRVLGNPAIARSSLSKESVDSAIQAIDIVNGQRSRLQDELKCAEKSAQNAAKRLSQAEATLTEMKEKKETYMAKQSKDAQTHERRLAMDKLERDRGEEDIAGNRQLLEEALSKLESKKKTLELLRTSINKQYGR
ncbi:unnamed protein product [Phytomonas sp. Hart1]|nr:unnamed protein product [Phytomonas sp. Hart1]|eukprot:CCW68765.1 unnamed protein product [Phytomonas sp. isolate Hart1]